MLVQSCCVNPNYVPLQGVKNEKYTDQDKLSQWSTGQIKTEIFEL